MKRFEAAGLKEKIKWWREWRTARAPSFLSRWPWRLSVPNGTLVLWTAFKMHFTVTQQLCFVFMAPSARPNQLHPVSVFITTVQYTLLAFAQVCTPAGEVWSYELAIHHTSVLIIYFTLRLKLPMTFICTWFLEHYIKKYSTCFHTPFLIVSMDEYI